MHYDYITHQPTFTEYTIKVISGMSTLRSLKLKGIIGLLVCVRVGGKLIWPVDWLLHMPADFIGVRMTMYGHHTEINLRLYTVII